MKRRAITALYIRAQLDFLLLSTPQTYLLTVIALKKKKMLIILQPYQYTATPSCTPPEAPGDLCQSLYCKINYATISVAGLIIN